MGLRYFHYASSVFRPVRLESVFLFVTSTCNSLCRTCFYWDELNQGRDLTFEQIEKISQTSPQFHKLWISGGEPFLRKDLAEVIELFYRNSGARHVNLPTNGLVPGRLEKVIDSLLKRCPDLTIDLNFSLDGLANTHDTIRGVPNNFQKTLSTIEMAADRWSNEKRLRRNVITVITRENYRELVEMALKLAKEEPIDGQYFEIIRGNPMDPALKAIPKQELERLHRVLLAFHEVHAERLFSHLSAPARALARAWYLGSVRFHFDIHQQNYYGTKKWPMRCTAGQTTIVIDHDGHFRSCELRSKLGRLQDHEFDLTAALSSNAMKRDVADIPNANCWCTHSCFIHSSTKFSPKVLLFHLPWAYLKHQWQRLPITDISELEQYRVADAPMTAD